MKSSLVLSDNYSSARRMVLQATGAGLLTLLAPGIARAQAWRQIDAVRQAVGDAPVADKGLQLTLPLVAEDGSSVPLTVHAADLGAARVTRLELFAPRNPTPQVAIFDFGPEVRSLNLATRIRLSESQTVVAVAHGNDGKVYVAERPVRVTTSGCIAPAQSDAANEMKARVRVPGSWKAGESQEILTMISHPMITGLNADAAGNKPAARIIERFDVTLDDRALLEARYFRSLAANPYLKFEMAPGQAGELRFTWTEDTGRQAEHVERLKLA